MVENEKLFGTKKCFYNAKDEIKELKLKFTNQRQYFHYKTSEKLQREFIIKGVILTQLEHALKNVRTR